MQIEERKLLYFDHYQKIAKHYKGESIYHFIFKDVKTGDVVTLGSCYYSLELSKVLGTQYYEDIEEAKYDFDIIWNISNDNIDPINNNFEEVQAAYHRLLNEGINSKDINLAVIGLFNGSRTIKK